jgi:hypothetical protein
MKINDIIFEYNIKAPLKKELTFDEALAFIKKNCNQAYQNFGKNTLFRGSKNLDPNKCYYLDYSKGKRKSQQVSNHYTILMDESPYYKNYPKRRSSIICTTNISQTTNYGETFAIYPIDNTVIAVCPEYDIWYTRLAYKRYGLRTWHCLTEFLEFLGVKEKPIKIMQQQIENDPVVKENFIDYLDIENIKIKEEKIDEELKNIIPYLIKSMRPDLCKFKLISTQNKLPKDKELWFSGPCIAVPLKFLDKLFINTKL